MYASAPVLLSAAALNTYAEIGIRTVVLEGDAAPVSGGTFETFHRPQINDYGRVAFVADSGGSTRLWSEAGDVLGVVVSEGDAAPDTTGLVFNGISYPILNDLDECAFAGEVNSGDQYTGSGIWSQETGGVHKVVRRGEVAPIADDPFDRLYNKPFGQVVSGIIPFVFNNQGQVAFFSELVNTNHSTAGKGIFRQTNNAIETVESTPPVGPGITGLSDNVVLADNGSVGYWTSSTGNTNNVGAAKTGDTAPDCGNAHFQSFGRPDINASGKLVFHALLAGTGLTTYDDEGIFTDATGLSLVAREGAAAPNTGTTFTTLTQRPLINDRGDIAFATPLSAPSDTDWALFSTAGDGSLRLVIREGDPAPGTEPGTVLALSGSGPLDIQQQLILNNHGNLAFASLLAGPSVNATNDTAIFAEINGDVILVAREGDPIEVAPGDFRTIGVLSETVAFPLYGIIGATGNGDGRPSAFNNFDELAFVAAFTDGSAGIFVAQPGLSHATDAADPGLGVDMDGHPALSYFVSPDLNYSLQRTDSLATGTWSLVKSPETYTATGHISYVDADIDLNPGGGAPSVGFYGILIQKLAPEDR